MTQYLSDKIKIISFLSIILVLYIHSGFHDIPNEIQGMTFNFSLQQAISGMLGRCAVPMFFAISGFLYFHNIDNWSTLWGKMRKRSRTLLIPYLIACLFPALFALAMEAIPWTKAFINGTTFSEQLSQPWYGLLNTLYVDAGNGSPYAFHLWFLRDLIVIVVFSPVLLLLKQRIGVLTTAIIFFALSYVDISYNIASSMFWFVIGAWLIPALRNYPPRLTYISLLVFVVLCVIQVIYPLTLWKYLQIPITVLGVSSLWLLYDRVVPSSFSLKSNRILSIICGFTFFIYLYHEPTLNVVRKLLIIPFGHTSFSFALAYIISPWIYAFVAIIIGWCFKKTLPRLYDVLMGGR